MTPIRILIVDDSVVTRKVLCEALGEDPAIQVAGTAADGRIALSRMQQLTPDLVTLDVEMPVMSGLETLAEIRKRYPKLPVIMFSTLTERGAGTTLDALALGASDYVTKPSNTRSLEQTLGIIRQELIPKVKALCARQSREPRPGDAATSVTAAATSAESASRVDLLAIGTSTGGPSALGELLPALSGDFPVPVVIVQHMPPLFTRLLAERLNKKSPLDIREGESGQELQAGQAWIAPGDYHMVLERARELGASGAESRAAGKFLPACSGCTVSFGGVGIRGQCAGGGVDRHGRRRSSRKRAGPPAGRASAGARRGELGSVGHAGTSGGGRLCPGNFPAAGDGRRNRPASTRSSCSGGPAAVNGRKQTGRSKALRGR